MADAPDSTAGPKLASIPELVEHVLLELPLHDILRTQQVDRTWRDIIKGSAKLQKALFFRPSADVVLKIRGLSDYTQSPCNCTKAPQPPVAVHLTRPERTKEQWWARDETDMTRYAVAINPFVTKGNCGFYDMDHGIQAYIQTIGQDASLRRMLLCQPPVEMIILYTDWLPAHMISRKPGAVGVTVADVFDAIATFNPYYYMQMWRSILSESYDASVTPAKDILKCQKEYIKGQLEEEPEVDPYYSADSDIEF